MPISTQLFGSTCSMLVRGIVPRRGRSAMSIFQGLVLRGLGELPVTLVHIVADHVTDQTAGDRADGGAPHAVAGTADRGAGDGTGRGTHDGARAAPAAPELAWVEDAAMKSGTMRMIAN